MSAAHSKRRLSKRDVETLLAAYDGDPVAAIEAALRRLYDDPTATFDELVRTMADEARVSVIRLGALVARDIDALDALAAELNETRSLPS